VGSGIATERAKDAAGHRHVFDVRLASPAHRRAALAMSLGADAFLPKPITPDRLISAVGTSA